MRKLTALVLLFAAACGERDNLGDGTRQGQPSSGPAPAEAPPPGTAAGPTIVFFGTSLTAGYGLSSDQAYPAIVQKLAGEEGVPLRTVNAGLSGETSAGALRRIDWVLRSPADVVVVETGANDGLRALDIRATRANITQLVRRIAELQPDARVLLVRMEAPRNFGSDYSRDFSAMYGEIAAATGATLVPFLLEGVAAVPELNQADGIHPNAAGAEKVAANVWFSLRRVLQTLPAKAPAR